MREIATGDGQTDRGQAAITVVLVAAALFVAAATAIAAVGSDVLERTRAQTAADSAALAALEGGPHAASRLAQRHDATVVSFDTNAVSGVVTVVVRVGGQTATASATNEVTGP